MRWYAIFIVGVLTACGGEESDPTGPSTGTLEIRTTTSGPAATAAYNYRVDGEPAQPIGNNAVVSRQEVQAGSHVVQLTGLPDGCTATGENPQTVSVTPGSTTIVDFAVTCVPPIGSIQVVTATSGPAPTSYDVVLDGASVGAIDASGTRTLESIPSGTHALGLAALPANCQLQGDNPRATIVQTARSVTASFTISCTQPPPETGSLRITTFTTGVDPDGFQVTIDGGAPQAIALNGALTLANVATGDHAVRVVGLASGCTITSENPRRVTVTTGATASVEFRVACPPEPVTGGIRVVTSTTGIEIDADGYAFDIDRGAAQPIGSSAAITVADVLEGVHTVTLSGLATNCRVEGTNPQRVIVVGETTIEVSFAVLCTAPVVGQWTRVESGTTYSLHSVWGSSPADVYTVGEPGGRFESAVFHYDGVAWSTQATEPGVTLYGVWGSGPTDVFAVGASPLGDRGYDGVILQYTGTAWAAMSGPGVGTADGSVQVSFYSVWGSSGADVFAVGQSYADRSHGMIAHYNGSGWSPMTVPSPDDRVFRDVFGTSPQDVYVVGYIAPFVDLRRAPLFQARRGQFSTGTILRYDGTQWLEVLSADGTVFSGVWASAPNDVFAVGSSNDLAAVYHFDGTAWAPMSVPQTGPLLDVWGSSASDVYAVGVGTILHFDGQRWSEVQSGADRLAGVWTTVENEAFAVGSGGTVLRGRAVAGGAAP
jgi:hypothetical protein